MFQSWHFRKSFNIEYQVRSRIRIVYSYDSGSATMMHLLVALAPQHFEQLIRRRLEDAFELPKLLWVGLSGLVELESYLRIHTEAEVVVHHI
jgi:hypothetical protein